ncbi:hypothetical protein CTRI78_v005975 [Colletotrichum trifolii]|uniref:Uncharacterized protein n=1 Tax=Colletotrichum trifolii TaxID=5466 RepID=A0A4V3HW47_COLTR|nr:hypothetical protein CTRI78_v005975 [Colletotrichum trifolii]
MRGKEMIIRPESQRAKESWQEELGMDSTRALQTTNTNSSPVDHIEPPRCRAFGTGGVRFLISDPKRGAGAG